MPDKANLPNFQTMLEIKWNPQELFNVILKLRTRVDEQETTIEDLEERIKSLEDN